VLSSNLEKSLHRALAHANERGHEYATLEHLLLALTEDQDAVAVVRACSVDLDRLRREVLNYVDSELANLIAAHGNDAKPTASFQRVLQRATIHVQSSGGEQVTGANVLVAMFAERESHAAYFLQERGMTRFDAVNYISHGIAKAPGHSETRRGQEKTGSTPAPGRAIDPRDVAERLKQRHAFSLLNRREELVSSKTILNKGVALVILILVAPLCALIMLFIKLESRGPVLFVQQHRSFNNAAIPILKFRTRYIDRADPSGRQRIVRADPGMTRVGRVLRATSLDQLPQLINVLRGALSLR